MIISFVYWSLVSFYLNDFIYWWIKGMNVYVLSWHLCIHPQVLYHKEIGYDINHDLLSTWKGHIPWWYITVMTSFMSSIFINWWILLIVFNLWSHHNIHNEVLYIKSSGRMLDLLNNPVHVTLYKDMDINTILGIRTMAMMGRHYLRGSWVSLRSGNA